MKKNIIIWTFTYNVAEKKFHCFFSMYDIILQKSNFV